MAALSTRRHQDLVCNMNHTVACNPVLVTMNHTSLAVHKDLVTTESMLGHLVVVISTPASAVARSMGVVVMVVMVVMLAMTMKVVGVLIWVMMTRTVRMVRMIRVTRIWSGKRYPVRWRRWELCGDWSRVILHEHKSFPANKVSKALRFETRQMLLLLFVFVPETLSGLALDLELILGRVQEGLE